MGSRLATIHEEEKELTQENEDEIAKASNERFKLMFVQEPERKFRKKTAAELNAMTKYEQIRSILITMCRNIVFVMRRHFQIVGAGNRLAQEYTGVLTEKKYRLRFNAEFPAFATIRACGTVPDEIKAITARFKNMLTRGRTTRFRFNDYDHDNLIELIDIAILFSETTEYKESVRKMYSSLAQRMELFEKNAELNVRQDVVWLEPPKREREEIKQEENVCDLQHLVLRKKKVKREVVVIEE